ncbi:MAG: Ig-like domain-containing protein, partial [Muribaculaceae bacterium]|nr:Ig-like domain-containing protein [Muribaculaceae bacterium]
VLPDYAGNRNVTWKSSDEKIVTVDANGTIKAIGSGSAVITATAADGSGVSASCQVNVVDAKVTSITLSKTALGMRIGDTETITATVLPEYAAKREVTWTSDKPAVATVDANGKVTAVALGEATITVAATDGSGVTATCAVTVTNALATAISIDKTEATLRVRQSLKLTATVSPDGAVNAVNWSSNAPGVATVDKDGNVEALSVGMAVITATTSDGTNLTATCVITVEPALSETVTLDIHNLTLTIGQSQTLTATVLPDYAGNRNVTWQSSASNIAMVDSNGRVIALAEGTAVITATAADGSGASDQCNVTVERVRATSITIEPLELSIEQGESTQLHATVLPANAESKVVWSSLNPDIATVDADGNVVALEVGIAVITATTIDGSDLTATCVVTVTEPAGIADAIIDSVNVRVENGNEIVVSGTSDDTYVRVVNTAGMTVYYGTDKRISDLKPALYIVIVNSAATKVILN